MPFYSFQQTSSGGTTVLTSDLSKWVIIEAGNAEEANKRANEIGIYFCGVRNGADCSCCGDRWKPVSPKDECPVPLIDSVTNPSYYSSLNIHQGSYCIIHYENGIKLEFVVEG